MPTVFEMIINGDIPSKKVYEDDAVLAILDINPRAKGHTLVISKKVYPTISEAPEDLIAHMFSVVKKIDSAMRRNLMAEGTNVIINNSSASGQEIPHLHIHVIPRKSDDCLSFFPPVCRYEEGEIDRYRSLLEIK